MGRLGFTVADGPEIEDEWHNFEALNIPADHPARDPLENFFLSTAGAAAGIAITPAAPLAAAQPNQHGADSRDGAAAAAGADHCPGPRLSARHGRRDALSDVSSDRRVC